MDRYVALGSSFASGPGIDPLVDVGCGRSGRNYAHLVAEWLGLDLVDVSSAGATVDDVLTASQALMSGGTVPPQIGAVEPGTDLVTATVGGNDVGYLRTLLTCSYAADPAGAPPEAAAFLGERVDRAPVEEALAGLPARLAALVGAVRERAPQARVVLVDYLTVLPPAGSGCAALPMADDDLAFCRTVQHRLAAATADAARVAGADLVRASAASADHSACAAEPWVSGWEFGDVPGGGLAPYHPNAAGMAAVADLLADLLR